MIWTNFPAREKKKKEATEEHLEVKLTAWPTVQKLFLGRSPLFFLCQVLICPCHIKWQISGHLTFLPNPLGRCSVFNDIVCFLSSQLGAVVRKVTCGRTGGKEKCLEGQCGMLGWVSDFGASVWRIGPEAPLTDASSSKFRGCAFFPLCVFTPTFAQCSF